MLTETFELVNGDLVPPGLQDGKIIPGRTVLRDPQTFGLRDIEWVKSGSELVSADGWYFRCGGDDEQSALNGERAQRRHP